VIPLVRDRIDKLEDFASYAEFFFSGKVAHKAEELLPKGRTAADVKPWLEAVLERFDTIVKWDHSTLDAAMRELCEKLQIKPKDLFMPIRVAVTGRTATPGLFETMEVLGKEVCRTRTRDAILALKAA